MPRLQCKILKERCAGSGVCVSVAPYVFSLDEDGKAAVADLNGADEDTLIEASQGCPTSAILLIDTETGEAVCP